MSNIHSAGRTAADALTLLNTDRQQVRALFKAYGQLVRAAGEGEEKQRLALEICIRVTVHATVEEELLYPAARAVLEDEGLVDESGVKHALARELIAQIYESTPADPLYDAKVKVLGEYVDHHARDEEGKLFPAIRMGGLDLDALGTRMAARTDELMAEMDEPEMV